MKQTLRNIVLGTVLAGALFGGCREESKPESKADSTVNLINQPEWRIFSKNQRIRYIYGKNSSSYELLTDLDTDNIGDILERKACGYNGEAEYGCQHVFYVKEEFSIPDDMPKIEPIRRIAESHIAPKTEITFVESDFFKPYQ